MTTSFRLPDLGEGIHEAEILEIPVKKGQQIKEGDVILAVETDKAAVDIPSPCSGTVAEIKAAVGDIAQVGDVLFIFTDSAATIEKPESMGDAHHNKNKIPVAASPSTRRVARELGVDLHHVKPTGTKGRVTAEDVRRYAETSAEPEKKEKQTLKEAPAKKQKQAVSPGLPDFSQWGEIERQPFRSIRRATAQRMTTSWSQIPHVNCQDVADITKLEEFRQRHKKEIEAVNGKLTMTVFALKAVATALKVYPQFNASLDVDSQEIILKKYFHIGVAVDTEHGLMVPVIRDVDRKSIKEISIELYQSIKRAKDRSSTREEMIGGTFTISNAGAIGGGFFSAIINHPEVAILGLGQGRMQPAVATSSQGRHQIVSRLLMPVVLCFDHRVADGADAIRFQRLIIDALEDPDELFISMI